MNSRSDSDNLVNFSTELEIEELDSKEGLLSFPFDHLYACSETGDNSQALQLREVEISTQPVAPDCNEAQKIAILEIQNKKLKELLIYHLDLIQQQNELMTRKEKAYQALRVEHDTLKLSLPIEEEIKKEPPEHVVMPPPPPPPPLLPPRQQPPRQQPPRQQPPRQQPPRQQPPPRPPPPLLPILESVVVTPVYNPDMPSSSAQQSLFQSLDDFLMNGEEDVKPDPFELDRPTDTGAILQSFLSSELDVPSLLEDTNLPGEIPSPTFVMIDNKRQNRVPKAVEPNNEPKYIVTTNIGNQKISRNRKRSTGIGSFSRMPKTKAPIPKPEKTTVYDNLFDTTDHSKTNYDNSKLSKYTTLQERMQLIEPTPVGEDPYQIGEAEMREQSPIPKLMLQKTNHGRMRICSDSYGDAIPSTSFNPTPTRRIYDTMSTVSPKKTKRAKISTEERYNLSNTNTKKSTAHVSFEEDQDVDVEKIDGEMDWEIFSTNKPRQTSLCDFSYGESSANLVNAPMDIRKMRFPDIFAPGPANADSFSMDVDFASDQQDIQKTKKRGARTTSLAGPLDEESSSGTKRAPETKGRKKRALSTAASAKRSDLQPKVPAKPRARRAVRAKKTPVPGMKTNNRYHTSMGDADFSWYLGQDPDVKKEDLDSSDNISANVEVPRWREKSFSGSQIMQGTENLHDKVFEKRHQKLEAEERRQLRWHMRRVREQRHVERLKLRHRDPWGPSSVQTRGEYTVWPQPARDLQYIEITDTLPVTAFGEDVPNLPEKNFEPPWMQLSEALKRSKRSKTLH